MPNTNDTERFPGYPHYPAGDDITRSENNNGVMPLAEDATAAPSQADHTNEREADTFIVPGNDADADVTSEDLQILNATEQNMDTTDGLSLQHAVLDNVDEDGDPLNEESNPAADFTGESLDVPGSEDDDNEEQIGEEDEENNYYSLGGDLHENQEENKGE